MYDKEQMAAKGYILMRMLIHNGSEGDDIKVSWDSNTIMKLRIKWPVFMSDSTMLAGCLSSTNLMDDSNGDDPFADEEHQVYVDMAKNAEELRDNSGNIHSEGIFQFQNPVDEQKFHMDVFQLPIDDDGAYVTILQILFTELVDGVSFASPTKGIKKGRKINFPAKSCKSPPPRRPPPCPPRSPIASPSIASPGASKKKRRDNAATDPTAKRHRTNGMLLLES